VSPCCPWRVFCAAVLVFVVSPVSQALDLFPNIFGDDDTNAVDIFEGGDQYVKLVDADKDDATRPNEHPIQMRAEDIRTVLEALVFEKSGGLFDESVVQVPLFVPSEVALLTAKLPEALASAEPTQDVIFVVDGRHQGPMAKERMAVAGRVFYLDGKLNMILGDVHKRFIAEGKARQMAMAANCGDCVEHVITPKERFVVGSRKRVATLELPWVPVQGVDSVRASDGQRRGDWLEMDVRKVVAVIQRQEREKAVPESVRREAQELSMERRRMREEMARMRKEMQAINQAPTEKSLEERLVTLDDLKARGLLTEEEYQAKRREILDDI
jgi:hypothetical protein